MKDWIAVRVSISVLVFTSFMIAGFLVTASTASTAQPTSVDGPIDYYGKSIEQLVLLGQTEIGETGRNKVGPTGIYHASGVLVDRSAPPDRLYIYVVDTGNNRILGFNYSCEISGTCQMDGTHPASIVIGQLDMTTASCNGDNNLGFNQPPTSSTLCLTGYPLTNNTAEHWMRTNIEVDSQGNLYVPDVWNNRVLKFNQPFSDDKTDGKGDGIADFVWGQDDMSSNGRNRGSNHGPPNPPDDRSLWLSFGPPDHVSSRGVSVDAEGSVWVADTFNNRVLRFPPDSQRANLVLGQPDFTSSGCVPNGPLDRMCTPTLAKVHPSTGKLYVLDEYPAPFRVRLLEFSPPFISGMSASRVITPNQDGPFTNWDGWDGTGEYMFQSTGFVFNTYRKGEYANGEIWLNEHSSNRALLIDLDGNIVDVVGAKDKYSRGGDVSFIGCGGDIYLGNYVWHPGGAIGLDHQGNIYLADEFFHTVYRYALPYETHQEGSATCLPEANGVLFDKWPNQQSSDRLGESVGLAVFEDQLLVRDEGMRIKVYNNYMAKPFGADANYVLQGGLPGRNWMSGGIDDADRLWLSGEHGQIRIYQLPITSDAVTPIADFVKLYWADTGSEVTRADGTNYVQVGAIAFDRRNRAMYIADALETRIFRVSNYNEFTDKLYVDMVIGQRNKTEVRCNQGLPGPNAETLCTVSQIKFDRRGNLFVVDNAYECHGNRRIVVFTADDLHSAETLFPNLRASIVFNAPDFTEVGDCAYWTVDKPGSPVSLAFNSRNQMVVGNDGYYGDSARRELGQLWFYADPLVKQTPDASISLYMGTPGEIVFDQDDNLIIQDHTWYKVWAINLDTDPEWLEYPDSDLPPLGYWQENVNLPHPMSTPFALAGQQLIVYNDTLYLFGGQTADDTRLTSVYYSRMSPEGILGSWVSATSLPGRYYDHAVVRVEDQVYLLTGAAGATAVYRAPLQPDGSLGTWQNTSPLAPSRQNFAAASYDTHVYVSGGNSGGTRRFVQFASVQPDGSLSAWKDTTPLPVDVEGHTMVAADGYLYVVAPDGSVYSAPVSSDGSLGTWASTTPLPATRSSYATFEYDGQIFVLGGDSQSVYYTSVGGTGSLDPWEEGSPLPEQRRGAWAGTHNDVALVLGGQDGGVHRDTGYSIGIQALRDSSDASRSDLNARFIKQMPRYDYDASKNRHTAGDPVSFVAHIANRGDEPTGSFKYHWYIDDSLVLSGTHSSLEPSEEAELTLHWTWQPSAHRVRIELDPDNAIHEVSEQNNVLEDRTDALAVGFWVEQSVYDWFNEKQVTLGLGSASWDDWAQRQLRVWNEMFADAITPLTPEGIIDRVRLDKVTVVPDGALPPCATNFPAPNDKTIDLQWGFPSEGIGIDYGRICGHLNYYFDHPESLNVEYSLMHELSHARYLIDLYGLNVHVGAARLSSSVSPTASTLTMDRDVENDPVFPLPAYLSVGGELVLCESKIENAFGNCSRGEEGTTPRSHSVGDLVNLAAVRLQDGHGNLIQGSPALPVIGFDDHLYYNRYPDDLMSGGLGYGQHSAYAWNRIAGHRPVCGNYNPPCNIGEYLNDIPNSNILEVWNRGGEPLVGARVEVYQANPFPIWYGKYFDSSPDIVSYTNAQGQATLGSFPFGGDSIIHGYGYSNGLVLLRISSGEEAVYRFFEVTEANEAYWTGHQDIAVYSMTVDLPQGSAVFHTLEVDIVGEGDVDVDPDQASYVHGETVTLTATAQAGWTFVAWSGDIESTDNPLKLMIQDDTQLIATFTQDEYSLDVTTVGEGGVAVHPHQASYVYGDTVTLTATAHSGWAFAGWSGAVVSAATPLILTMERDTTIRATFEPRAMKVYLPLVLTNH